MALLITFNDRERVVAEMNAGGGLYGYVVNVFMIIIVCYYTAILFVILEFDQDNYNYHNRGYKLDKVSGQAKVPAPRKNLGQYTSQYP